MAGCRPQAARSAVEPLAVARLLLLAPPAELQPPPPTLPAPQGHLFAALRTTRLVPPGASWQELRYSRGGRTDKGVSGERR